MATRQNQANRKPPVDIAPVAAQIADTIFAAHLQYRDEVTSTNTLALAAAAQGAPEGTVFIAGAQTAGRGRGGHSWHSAPGDGLYLSVLLRPALPPADVLWLSLMTGVAVHDAIRESTGLIADLRWPNDLLFGDKKFCGILAETQGKAVVIGIGINLNHAGFPPELAPIATSLRLATGADLDSATILAAILRSLDREYKALLDVR